MRRLGIYTPCDKVDQAFRSTHDADSINYSSRINDLDDEDSDSVGFTEPIHVISNDDSILDVTFAINDLPNSLHATTRSLLQASISNQSPGKQRSPSPRRSRQHHQNKIPLHRDPATSIRSLREVTSYRTASATMDASHDFEEVVEVPEDLLLRIEAARKEYEAELSKKRARSLAHLKEALQVGGEAYLSELQSKLAAMKFTDKYQLPISKEHEQRMQSLLETFLGTVEREAKDLFHVDQWLKPAHAAGASLVTATMPTAVAAAADALDMPATTDEWLRTTLNKSVVLQTTNYASSMASRKATELVPLPQEVHREIFECLDKLKSIKLKQLESEMQQESSNRIAEIEEHIQFREKYWAEKIDADTMSFTKDQLKRYIANRKEQIQANIARLRKHLEESPFLDIARAKSIEIVTKFREKLTNIKEITFRGLVEAATSCIELEAQDEELSFDFRSPIKLPAAVAAKPQRAASSQSDVIYLHMNRLQRVLIATDLAKRKLATLDRG